MLKAILQEPPIRRLAKLLVRALPFSPVMKSLWDAVERPQNLFGALYAAQQAKQQGHQAITVIEFGVAGGYGLLTLQRHTSAVELATGVQIHVYGFDTGTGLPEFSGDHRDHPDKWRPGDYRMDEQVLRQRLLTHTVLVLGNVSTTVLSVSLPAPIGFMAMDLDLYSSTAAALRILSLSDAPRLIRCAIYFDDLDEAINHRWAGELLAIEEFNRDSIRVKIDRWRGIQTGRPFPEAPWLRSMYLAHDLDAISRLTLSRAPARMR